MSYPRIQQPVIDCSDPERLAAFWAGILDRRYAFDGDAWAMVNAEPLMIAFQKVPEPKPPFKNRIHLDILVTDVAAAVARALELGASMAGQEGLRNGDRDGYVVMLDPEGNEFCFTIDTSGEFQAMTEQLFAEADKDGSNPE